MASPPSAAHTTQRAVREGEEGALFAGVRALFVGCHEEEDLLSSFTSAGGEYFPEFAFGVKYAVCGPGTTPHHILDCWPSNIPKPRLIPRHLRLVTPAWLRACIAADALVDRTAPQFSPTLAAPRPAPTKSQATMSSFFPPKQQQKEEEEEEEGKEEGKEEEEKGEKRVKKTLPVNEKKKKKMRSQYKWHGGEAMLEIWMTGTLPAANKIAAFDMDGTLIATKSGARFARNAEDWVLWSPTVANALRKCAADGYKVVVLTNQAGIQRNRPRPEDVVKKVTDIANHIGVSLHAFAAAKKDTVFRKPATGMWDHLVRSLQQQHGVTVSLADSFFVGDAAGRDRDFSDSDKMLAENAKISFFTPEQYFPARPVLRIEDIPYAVADPARPEVQEMVVFVGSPASGKSTFFMRFFEPQGYVRVNLDTLKTHPKSQRVAREALAEGKSVVIDNTNADRKARARYTALAEEKGIVTRCVYFATSREVAAQLNRIRGAAGGRRVPAIAINTYYSRLEMPSVKEGFQEVLQVPCPDIQ